MTPSPDTLTLTGRELDAEVAVKIFGWRWLARVRERSLCLIVPPEHTESWIKANFKDVTGHQSEYCRFAEWDQDFQLPRYSTDPAAMMQVVEKMRERGCCIDLSWGEPPNPDVV